MKKSEITETEALRSPRRGDTVISNAGHDKGLLFAVLAIEGERNEYLILADGKTRTVAKPKKKKLRHCRLLPGKYIPEEMFAEGNALTDARIRKHLRVFLSEEDN